MLLVFLLSVRNKEPVVLFPARYLVCVGKPCFWLINFTFCFAKCFLLKRAAFTLVQSMPCISFWKKRRKYFLWNKSTFMVTRIYSFINYPMRLIETRMKRKNLNYRATVTFCHILYYYELTSRVWPVNTLFPRRLLKFELASVDIHVPNYIVVCKLASDLWIMFTIYWTGGWAIFRDLLVASRLIDQLFAEAEGRGK